MENIYYFVFRPSLPDGKLVGIFSKDQRDEAINYLNSIRKWKHSAEIKIAEWNGGELPSNEKYYTFGSEFFMSVIEGEEAHDNKL